MCLIAGFLCDFFVFSALFAICHFPLGMSVHLSSALSGFRFAALFVAIKTSMQIIRSRWRKARRRNIFILGLSWAPFPFPPNVTYSEQRATCPNMQQTKCFAFKKARPPRPLLARSPCSSRTQPRISKDTAVPEALPYSQKKNG